jgi:hypothetical protein
LEEEPGWNLTIHNKRSLAYGAGDDILNVKVLQRTQEIIFYLAHNVDNKYEPVCANTEEMILECEEDYWRNHDKMMVCGNSV